MAETKKWIIRDVKDLKGKQGQVDQLLLLWQLESREEVESVLSSLSGIYPTSLHLATHLIKELNGVNKHRLLSQFPIKESTITLKMQGRVKEQNQLFTCLKRRLNNLKKLNLYSRFVLDPSQEGLRGLIRQIYIPLIQLDTFHPVPVDQLLTIRTKLCGSYIVLHKVIFLSEALLHQLDFEAIYFHLEGDPVLQRRILAFASRGTLKGISTVQRVNGSEECSILHHTGTRVQISLPPNENSFTPIFIKLPGLSTWTIEITLGRSLGDFKNTVFMWKGIKEKHQTYIFNREILDDDNKSLLEYNLQTHSTLYLVIIS